MVYKEAEVLGVPVLTTNTTSATELVGEKGFVCDNTMVLQDRQLQGLKSMSGKMLLYQKLHNPLSESAAPQ